MKIRTDFVTNSSSSSFVFEIKIKETDGNTISYGEKANPDFVNEDSISSIEVRIDPKRLATASSIDELVSMLSNGITQGEGEPFNAWGFDIFLDSIRLISSMDNIMSIYMSGEKSIPLGNDYYKLEAIYQRDTNDYFYREQGTNFDEIPNGGSGGDWHCDLKGAIKSKKLKREQNDTGHLIISGVSTIKASQYEGRNDIVSLEIKGDVQTIEAYAFANCQNLVSVTICNGVTTIGNNAFSYCESLTNLIIPDSITSIGDYAFYDCNNLICNEEDNAYYLGNENNPYLLLLKAKNTEITSHIINSNTKFIYTYAFAGCEKLTNIIIPNKVARIGSFAWLSSGITNISLPDSVTYIGRKAFQYCSELISISIPDSVTWIEEFAFDHCDKLKYNEYDNAYYLGNNNNPYILLFKAKDTGISTCSINANTKFINDYAFHLCNKLTNVNIPNKVARIGTSAFFKCSKLTNINIPTGVTAINDHTFNHCVGLTNISLPNGVSYIGKSAFGHCKNLISISIPNSVSFIGNTAFPDQVTIYTTKGSYAVKYAKNNDLKVAYL